MEAFPQAQKYIPSYQDGGQGGDQQQILMQYLQAFAQLQGMPIEQLMQALQQMPEEQQSQTIMQIVQMVDQVMSQQGQGQDQSQGMDMAQSGDMPMDPNQAVQMALGGAYNLKKFTDPYPAAAELPKAKDGTAECDFGYYFDPNVGKCVPYKWYTASKMGLGSAGLVGGGYGLYKGIPYAMERRQVNQGLYGPLRRPIQGFGEAGDFVLEGLTKDRIGDKVRNWSYFGEQISEPVIAREYQYIKTDPKTGKQKTTGWTKDYYNNKQLKQKNLEFNDYRDVEKGKNTYLKHSPYGDARWVEQNITPKFNITPQEWAKLSTTAEGRRQQRFLVRGLTSPNYASAMKAVEAGMSKIGKVPTSVKLGALAAILAGAGYLMYNAFGDDESPTEIPQGGTSNPDTSSEGELQRQLELLDKQYQQQGTQTMPSDTSKWMPNPWVISGNNKLGGSPSPMGYGMFPAIMRNGGSFSNAAPDIYDTEGYLNNYNDNEFKRYIQENIDNSIYERGLKAGNAPGMGQMTPMQMQARRGGSSKKKILNKYAVDGETNPWSSVWNNPVNPFANQSYYLNADQPGEYKGNVSVTYPTRPDEMKDQEIKLDPSNNASGDYLNSDLGKSEQQKENESKAQTAMDYAEEQNKKIDQYEISEKDQIKNSDEEESHCPKGYKWDPSRQQCYRDKYVSGQANANALISGINAASMAVDMFSKNKFKESNKQAISTLADNVMPKKNYNGVDFYGYEDVNTFTPNPRYGTYNRSVYQPPGSEYMADGGEIQYLTKKQINDLLAKGGQIEFL